MAEREVKKLPSGQYLLISDEPSLIERSLDDIKKGIVVDTSFDLDDFSMHEFPDIDAALGDIIPRLYMTPLNSTSDGRLVIVRHLEHLNKDELKKLAAAVAGMNSGNYLVLTYWFDKLKGGRSRTMRGLKPLFKQAECRDISAGPEDMRKWLGNASRRASLNFDDATIHYLKEAFRDDVTGVGPELRKIQNYIEEAGPIDAGSIKKLAKTLLYYDKYVWSDALLDGDPDALLEFEEMQRYIGSNARLVDSITRKIIDRASKGGWTAQNDRKRLVNKIAQLIAVDKKIKTGSVFMRLMMELFILQYAGTRKNGVSHGR